MVDRTAGRGSEGAVDLSTRRELLRQGAGVGFALLLAGVPAGRELVDAGRAEAAPRAAGGKAAVRAFASRPDLKPPLVEVVHAARGTAPGLLFLAPSSGPGQRGVLILDNTGDVVWFHPTAPRTAMNFRAALYRGEPVLTWWEGKSKKGLGEGDCVIVDASYREIARFRAGHHRPADLHEFLLTPHGTALVTSIETRRVDLRRLGGGSRSPVIGSVIQELEVPSARVLFDWRSLDHVAVSESRQKVGPRFDYFHANSIDLTPDGHLLVSARNTCALYKINRRTGAVMWRLGGKRSDFAMAPGTRFAWQHDARSHGDGSLISLFDDGAAPQVEPQSRALLLRLDSLRMRATLVRADTHRPPLLARYTGSMQLLPGGNVLVGWGSEPYFTEFARDGAVRFDARLPHGGQTYRALRFPWTGTPVAPPVLAARTAAAGHVLHASWNGATQVTGWRLLTGMSPGSLSELLIAPRHGFETELGPIGRWRYAAVAALDRHGAVLAHSRTLQLESH
jgi:hypothetical protein